jgi:hypothetical protein
MIVCIYSRMRLVNRNFHFPALTRFRPGRHVADSVKVNQRSRAPVIHNVVFLEHPNLPITPMVVGRK